MGMEEKGRRSNRDRGGEKKRVMESEALHKPSTFDSEEWSRDREGIELEGSSEGREGEDTWGKS